MDSATTTTSTSTTSVIIAASQSVGKVFVIGCVGVLAVKFPKKSPLLPSKAVGTVARFVFHVLLIPLFYATIARSVSISSIGQYWFAVASAFGVISLSYAVATVLRLVIPVKNVYDFQALRIASCFPNIVALPILLFPSLCEYEVVQNIDTTTTNGGGSYTECVDSSNTMIFLYFFGFSILFWSIGHPSLIHAAKTKREQQQKEQQQQQQPSSENLNHETIVEDSTKQYDENHDITVIAETTTTTAGGGGTTTTTTATSTDKDGDTITTTTTTRTRNRQFVLPSFVKNLWFGILQALKSPGFLAMLAGILTACIPPLQRALFEHGGSLRFLGSAAESLGNASSPLSTMVVAASLVPPSGEAEAEEAEEESDLANDNKDESAAIVVEKDDALFQNHSKANAIKNELIKDLSSFLMNEAEENMQVNIIDDDIEFNNRKNLQQRRKESPILSDPNFGPTLLRRESSMMQLRKSFRRNSQRLRQKVISGTRTTPEMRRTYIWFLLARLIVTPGLVVAIIYGLDAAGVLSGVSGLGKLVTIINSALPGALIVVVILKSNEELSDTASVVAKVYLPSYVLSIITIALWTSVGLWIVSMPSPSRM